jgi:hypothetical protein
MKAIKFMLMGIIAVLLGLALLDSGIQAYLLRTGFISLDTLSNIFPLISVGLILIGVILGIIGLFIKDERGSAA